MLPTEGTLAVEVEVIDPVGLRKARDAVVAALASPGGPGASRAGVLSGRMVAR